ncbi:MAG TPA: riboflavin synthase [Pirellulaceae bacterium]|jgi:riboflavin synthase
MFTGLVEELASVEKIVPDANKRIKALRFVIQAPLVAKDARIGDSVAVNGCCLTVVKKNRGVLEFEAGSETLSRTNLGRLKSKSRVNLERSLQLGERLGGHLVTGHIDGQALLLKRRDEGEWSHFIFRTDTRLMRQMVNKGSVAVDGVSLTVVEASADRFSVALIPHTLAHTTLGSLEIGDAVNIETDLLAKYVQRQLQTEK